MFDKTIPLNEFITLQRGFDLPKSKRQEGSIPIIASTCVTGYHNEAKVKAPGVVIGRSGSIGGGQYIEEDYWPLNTSLWVKDFKGHHPKYVYYLMKSIDFSGFNAGTGVPTLNRNHLSSLLVADIGYEKEREVAEALSSLDEKISNNTAMNATLEKIAQRIFKSWFVDFDPVKANAEGLPFDGLSPEIQSLFPNEFEESELGMIPKGWEVKSLSEVSFISNEKQPLSNCSLQNYISTDNMLPLRKGVISASKLPRVNKVNKFEKGDILFSNIRPYFKKVWFAEFEGGASGDVLIWKPNKDSYISPLYLHNILSRDDFINYSVRTAKGVKMPRGDKEAMMDFKIVCPSERAIEEFTRFNYPLMERIITNQGTNKILSKIRDKLLPRLISGKITIQKAEELLEEAS